MLKYLTVPTFSPQSSLTPSPLKQIQNIQTLHLHQNQNVKHYVLLPNQWKLTIVVYWGVLFGAVFINISIVHPIGLNAKLLQILHQIHPVIQDLIVLAVLLSISIPFISWIVIPVILKWTRKWVMDDIVNLQSPPSRSWKCSEIARRGLIQLPNHILLDHEQFQSFPIKWKFCILIYVAVLISESVLWCILYKQGLSQWKWTNIHEDHPIDIRIRYVIFLSIDLLVSIPVVSYLVLPLFVNWICVKWVFRKSGSGEGYCHCLCRLMSDGISCLETFDQRPLISQLLNKETVALEMERVNRNIPNSPVFPAESAN